MDGRVFVAFVIQKNGKIDKESVKVHESLWPSLDKEAVRLIKGMPIWNPGKNKGMPEKVQMIMPVFFKINEALHNKKRRKKKSKTKF